MIRPMLSGKLDWDKLRYPVFVSPKVDGIRCVVLNGQPFSRTAKVLPNWYLQALVKRHATVLESLDGELVVGAPAGKEVYNRSMSGIMSQSGKPAFEYLVFDLINEPTLPYGERRKRLTELKDQLPDWVTILEQKFCRTREEVEAFEEECLAKGYEGVIVRAVLAPYKYGRSTVNEGYLLKLKRYADAEAEIIGFEELMHNDNEGFLDEQGYTRHTSHKANQRAGGVLGALQCRLIGSNPVVYFGIGTGFDFQQRQWIWENREQLAGKIVKFKFLPYGTLESTQAPRHPVFLAFRHPIDFDPND